ncbi:hypothetical protein P154DRAFT_534766 [Amniculicola lignicola CBS 123094]|uniref:Uncharacterized protein n=1 Tax=Amniculicola lignicola CBS 123094 TaxID=1392246 RepID=A0A6A5WG87_9PLEO|nr:hypothetical protein P154DRAFT_534766 [Amniculicola lignicola CBS 123094]
MADPNNLPALSERSYKFYNGTYKWSIDGYEDERGVFHPFTKEPPPTPNPYTENPPFQGLSARKDSAAPGSIIQINHGPLAPNYSRATAGTRPHVPHPSFNPMLVRAFVEPSADQLSSTMEVTSTGFRSCYRKMELRPDLFSEQPELIRERLRGRLEGMMIGQWYAAVGVSLEEAYKLVGLEYPDGVAKTAIDIIDAKEMPPPPKKSTPSGEAEISPLSDSSGFSDALSDVEMSKLEKEVSKEDTGVSETPIKKASSGAIRKKAEYAYSGLREKAGTPVNAGESSLSHPTLPPSLSSAGAKRGRNRGFGRGDDSDSESGNDGDKASHAMGGHYDESKEKKQKKDGADDDSGDDGMMDESNPAPAGSAKDRKDSKQTSSTANSRKSSKAETAGGGAQDEEMGGGIKISDGDSEMKEADPVNEEDTNAEAPPTTPARTPARRGRAAARGSSGKLRRSSRR